MQLLVRVLCLFLLGTALSHSQEWPQKAVRIIVPFPAGGSADLIPRLAAEKLAQQWGQPVIVENRPGAAGNIGADAVFKSEPDGYTLLSAPPPPLVINRLLYPNLSYDATQFVPITVIAAIPNVLLVHPNLGVGSVAELIALAKAKPGKLNYASQGSGSTSHLTAELFMSMAGGLDIMHVPYKGTAPALADLVAGQVDMMCDNLGVSAPHVRAGRLRALAVAWYGIVAPPRTPAAVAEKVAAGVREALQAPDVRKRLQELSASPMGLSPAETATFMKAETERWAAVIRSANVKVD